MVAVGTMVWLASELMFFAALFAFYFSLRGNLPTQWAERTEQLEESRTRNRARIMKGLGLDGSSDEAETTKAAPPPPSIKPKAQDQKAGRPKSVARPVTDADFEALPAGAMYVDPDDGQTYRKP